MTPEAICEHRVCRTFQITKPFSNIPVLKNVAIGALIREKSLRKTEKRAEEVLEFVGMREKRDVLGKNLTIADRKRLEISRGLATSPKLFLLDEVMAGLTPMELQDMMELLRNLVDAGITLFVIEHIMKAKRFVETGDPVTHSPETNARIIKKAANLFGAEDVGICYAHPNLIYSHQYDLVHAEHKPLELPEGCTNAIVMIVGMDYTATRNSPDAISGAATGRDYSIQAVLANLLAAFIRGLGYQAAPSGNDTAISVPLAMAAGLGELGRMGLLITPRFGPRVRICKVFTDMPLAYDTYRPFGVAKFCETCKKCAKMCPSGAISFDGHTMKGPTPSNFSRVLKWYINPEKCFLFWVKNWMDCNNCVMACPFNKHQGRIHDMTRLLIRKMPIFNRFFVRIDDLMGYGKPVKNKNYWETQE